MATVAILGTLDTKLAEFLKLRELVLSAGAKDVVLIDAGREEVQAPEITVTHSELVKYGEVNGLAEQKPNFQTALRGEIVDYLAQCAERCVRELHQKGAFHAIISAGGTGGTSLATRAMRALPIGFPKVMVSTVGSGDISPFVGETDIFMVYSIVDIAGWNGMLDQVFRNAASAVVGMAARSTEPSNLSPNKPKRRVGITMFGVTTPCVDMIREQLTKDGSTEVYVFHATGHGGKAMERLVETGKLDAVVDLTTTEIADHLMGGNMSAGPHRLEAALIAGIPYVVSVGACDMVNFGAKETVPEKYKERKLYIHNPAVTLMRTTPAECTEIGDFIAEKVSTFAKNPSKVKLILPGDGVSIISSTGQAFHNAEADKALFNAIANAGEVLPSLEIIRRSEPLNDRSFAETVVRTLDNIRA
ncbi:MAG: hypothetical protein Q9159_006149 [Coniocarpon cinnabarinum]